MFNHYLKYGSLFFLLVLFNNCQNKELPTTLENSTYQIPVQTGDGWETASLDSVGMAETPILTLASLIENQYYSEVHSIVIVKNGLLNVSQDALDKILAQ